MGETRMGNCRECQSPIPYEIGKKYVQSKIITGDRQPSPGWFEPEAESPFVSCPNCGTEHRIRKANFGQFFLEKA